jgi:hypothetical protein
MARSRKGASPPSPEPPQVPPARGIALLTQLIDKGKALLASPPLSSDEHGKWVLLARNYLEKAFGINSPNVASVTEVGVYGSFPLSAGEEYWEERRRRNLTTQINRLEGLVELLQTEVSLDSGDPSESFNLSPVGHQIFVVHGHDAGVLEATARLLTKLELRFTILHEQPNQGRTLIEKFEEYSEVGFAVVLLTADDRGGTTATPYDSQCPRARQNVILELGYFLGRLGRSRVCALYRPGVEIPSDYDGVLYVVLDERGAWKIELAKELRAAGFDVDLNKAV